MRKSYTRNDEFEEADYSKLEPRIAPNRDESMLKA